MDFRISDRMRDVKGSAIRDIFKRAGDPSVISLGGGDPAPELFPGEALAAIAAELLTETPALVLRYGVTEGCPPLREAVREMLAAREGIGRDYDDVLIVTGGQQGIELTAKVLLNEGDIVLTEDPSFIGALNAFRCFGAKPVGVSTDGDGMIPEALEAALTAHPDARLLYTIPTFQNPTGSTMPPERRQQIYEIAKRRHLPIFEDNPYGELAFDGVKVPTLKSLDTEGIVLYCGSFSKILAPGLRLGFLCGHRDLLARLTIAKQAEDVHTPLLTQYMAERFLRRYSLNDVIARLCAVYAHRCEVMLEAIRREFPASVTLTPPRGGLFLFCDAGAGVDSAALARRATDAGVVFVPGSTFYTDPTAPRSTFRLNFTASDDEKIREGIRRIGKVLRETQQ